MSDSIQRPAFSEGQILAASALNSSIDHARGQLARHERGLHSWGIAEGLVLASNPAGDGTSPVDVALSEGLAIDGSGRELVVTTPLKLSETELPGVLLSQGPGDDPAQQPWYPVFLSGCDQAAVQAVTRSGSCGAGAAAAQIDETCTLSLGRPGDESSSDEQVPPSLADGPDGAQGSTPWSILVGYVQASQVTSGGATVYQFTKAARTVDGLAPLRFVGVRADLVEAQSPRLELTTPSPDGKSKAVLVLDAGAKNGPLLSYGVETGSELKPLFTIDGKGDAMLAGSLSSRVQVDVQVASGIATDGMLLPLPGSVAEADLTSGNVALHIQLTPLLPGPPEPPAITAATFQPINTTVNTPATTAAAAPSYDPTMLMLALGNVFGAADFNTALGVLATMPSGVSLSNGITVTLQGGLPGLAGSYIPTPGDIDEALAVGMSGLFGEPTKTVATAAFAGKHPFGSGTLRGDFGTVHRSVVVGVSFNAFSIPPLSPTFQTSDIPIPPTTTPASTVTVSSTFRPPPSAHARWLFPTPIGCSVDSDRRVSVRFRWLGTDGGGPVTVDVPGACRYLVIAQKQAKAIPTPQPLALRKVCP